MAILLIIASTFFRLSLSIFTNPRITKVCTFDRATPHSDRSYAGEVTIEQIDIFNRKIIVKIPLDKIVDLRLRYGSTAPILNLQILLITDRSARPITIGDLPYGFSKVKSQRIMQSMVEETDRIREFINLSIKPSYLVDGKSDYSLVPLGHKSKQKILEHTADILTFSSLASHARTIWNFDLNSQSVIRNHRWAMLSFVKTIELCEIKSIEIKRESSILADIIREFILLVSINGKLLHELDRDRYSLIAIFKDGSSFKCQNNYLRIFTSTNLATVREFAALVRSHLNLPEREASHLPNRESMLAELTHTKA